jgi:hypothetical protein
MGDVTLSDASGQESFRTSLPLAAAQTSMMIPYVAADGNTSNTVAVTNTSDVPAAATLSLFAATGVKVASRTMTLAAHASATGALASMFPGAAAPGAYIMIGSTQPATATVLLSAPGWDIAAIAVRGSADVTPGSAAPPVTATPKISVSGTSLNFGNVFVGQVPPAELTLTVSSTGTAPLTISSLTIQNPAFTIVSPPQMPYTVGDAALQLRVRFTPTAAGVQSGTLSIASNDPDPTRAILTISLAGTGTGTTSPPTGGNGTCLTPPANLVSWWSGDTDASDVTGSNNATLQGGVSFGTGEVGRAFSFDGATGYVQIGNPANLRFTNAITIEGWINPRAAPSGSAASGMNMASVLTKWGQKFDATPDSDSYGLWMRANGSALTLFAAIHQAGTSEPNIQGGSVSLNAWQHVAMTFDAATTQFALYLNGQMVASTNSPGAITATSRNVLIGREDSQLPRPFNGLIDELTVYSRALDASEISAIYNAGSLGKCKPGSPPNPTVNITVTPTSLDFGSVNVGQTSSAKTITVTNTSSASATVNLSASGPFTVSPSSLTLGANGGTGTASVTFKPTAPGPASGTLSITISGQSNPAASVTLTGTGTSTTGGGGGSGNIVSLKVETGSYSNGTFTNTQIPSNCSQGQCANYDTDDSTNNWAIGVSSDGNNLLNSVPKKALKNPLPPGSYFTYYTGPYSWGTHIRLTVTWSTGTPDVAYFEYAGFGNTSWRNAGGSQNLSVTSQNINPCKVFQASTQSSPNCGSPNQVLQITIAGGSGSPPASGGVSASPTSLDFGSVNVGQTSAAKTITVTNTGGASATVNLSASGPFTVSPSSLTLAANNGTGTASVTFKPTGAGPANGSLTVTINGQSTPAASVSVTGTGAALTPANFAGQWNTDYGPMTFAQNGSSVTGTYPNYSGTITGTVSGNVLNGNWSDTSGTGTFVFTLSASGSSFTGTWTRLTGSGNSGGTWNGTRASAPPPTSGSCITPAANLVSWWTGDGNAKDAGGNSGTLQGGVTFAAGKVGQAFSFDGSNGYVSIGNPANLRLTSAITIEGWINPRSGPSSGNNLAAVVTKWGQKADPTPDSDSYGLWLRSNGSALTMFTAIHQSGTSEPNLQGGTIPLNTWTHVAMTFDSQSGQYALYVNGQVVNSDNSPGAITATSRNVFIAREDSYLPRPFNGLIDEVAIFSRALSAAEIQAIYNAGAAGKCK